MIGLVAVSSLILLVFNETRQNRLVVINLAGKEIHVEIADDSIERERGLAGRDKLNSDGMLFIFNEPSYPKLWMKNTNFEIDIVWIDEHGTIIDLNENIKPETYPETFSPKIPAKYALELKGGMSDELNLQIGQEVRIPNDLST